MASMAFLAWFGLKILLSSLTQLASSSSCDNQTCNIINDCAGMLICINGNCNDDPVVNTNMCTQGSLPSPNDDASSCQPSGTLNCSGKFYPQYRCSPPVSSFTKAILTTNDFSEGGDGGYASECDDKFHDNSELVVALSTGWYDGGSRCGKMIRITSRNGTKSVTAKVVDERDSVYGCDEEHGGWPPCANNNINGNKAVWDALGLNMDMGEERVTWSMA